MRKCTWWKILSRSFFFFEERKKTAEERGDGKKKEYFRTKGLVMSMGEKCQQSRELALIDCRKLQTLAAATHVNACCCGLYLDVASKPHAIIGGDFSEMTGLEYILD